MSTFKLILQKIEKLTEDDKILWTNLPGSTTFTADYKDLKITFKDDSDADEHGFYSRFLIWFNGQKEKRYVICDNRLNDAIQNNIKRSDESQLRYILSMLEV